MTTRLNPLATMTSSSAQLLMLNRAMLAFSRSEAPANRQ